MVILTLALGLGAKTAIFSVTRINYQHWRSENHSFEGMAGLEQIHLTLTGRGDALFTRAALVSSGFFPLLGREPLLGPGSRAGWDRQ